MSYQFLGHNAKNRFWIDEYVTKVLDQCMWVITYIPGLTLNKKINTAKSFFQGSTGGNVSSCQGTLSGHYLF